MPSCVHSVQRAGAAHAAHHLVEDQQNAVAIAQLAHAAEVARHRRQRARGGTCDGLGDERDHVAGAQALDLRFQLGHQAPAVGLGRLVDAAVAVFVARRHVRDVDQQRRELRAPPGVAADRQRAERVAVIALATRDEVPTLRLPDLDEVLARHLQRRLDRLGATRHEVDLADTRRRVLDQQVGQRLGHFGGEKAGVRVSQPVDLRVHRCDHVRMPVAEARHRGAARCVDVLPAVGVAQHHAAARERHRQRAAERAVKHVCHGRQHSPVTATRSPGRARARWVR